MANCPKPSYCYDADPYPTEGSCDTKDFYLSGIGALGLVRCGTTITDPSDAVEMAALVASGALVIIPNIKASFDEPSAITIDPVTACGTTVTVNYDRVVTFTDAKVSTEVVQWYNEFKGRWGGVVLFECAEDRVSYVDQSVLLTVARSGENTNATAQAMTGTITWRDLSDPVPVPAPAGIFEA